MPPRASTARQVVKILSLLIFYVYWKNEENLSIRSLIFCKMDRQILFLLALRLSVWRFKCLLKWLNFVKTLATFGIIYATDPLLQNMTRIVCLCQLTFDIFNYKRCIYL